jgi:hypothetical protein
MLPAGLKGRLEVSSALIVAIEPSKSLLADTFHYLQLNFFRLVTSVYLEAAFVRPRAELTQVSISACLEIQCS